MTIESSVDELTAQTSLLLDTCVAISAGVSQKISDAVSVSTNSAIVPLMTMAVNLINTQSLLVTYIAKK